jgi:four helix bundle protein
MKKDRKTESFEDLEIWREGCDLAVEIYRNARAGELSKAYGLRDQITRAAVSIPANIAEGKERETVAELIRYLYIAKGSAGELRTHLHICYRIGYIDEGTCGTLMEQTKILSKKLSSFIRTLRRGASAMP